MAGAKRCLTCDNRHTFARMFEYDGGMTEDPLAQAARLLGQAAALIRASANPLAALLVAEGGSRLMDRTKISQIAVIDRDGTLVSKGCKSTTVGLKDLLGWDPDVARQHVRVAQHVGPRFALDGTPLEPVLPATAAAFATNTTTMHHVGIIATPDELPSRFPDQPRRPGLDRGQPRRGRDDLLPARCADHGPRTPRRG